MIFVATLTVGLGKQFGCGGAIKELARQLEHTDRDSLPVVRTIKRLRTLDNVCLWNDSRTSRLAEVRTRSVYDGLQQMLDEKDVWFSCDDDCEATVATLADLLEAVRSSGGICFAPYWARHPEESERFIVAQLPAHEPRQYRELSSGARVTPAIAGGFGLIAIARPALQRIIEANPDVAYTDRKGVRRNAIFLETIKDGAWLTEDIAFFSRVPADVPVEALCTGHTTHAGELLVLDVLQQEDLDAADSTPPVSA
jgi:hypothetical protein